MIGISESVFEVNTPSHGKITVNVCGKRYRFLLALLHEVAHARVAVLPAARVDTVLEV